MNNKITEALRGRFADFLRDSGIETLLRLESSLTVQQDDTLKYERIDKYRVTLLKYNELRCLMAFCAKHEINVWFGADKLCIGFNYRGNMRLSAYSVLPAPPAAGLISDRNVSVHPEIQGLTSLGDRI